MSIERRGRERREEEPAPYYLAARFSGEKPAGRAYFQAQDSIFANSDNCDLSVFRFQLDRIYHVVVLGLQPPQDLEQTLRGILSAGEAASLEPDILKVLQQRRARAIKQAPWVEHHYRPGEPL